MAGLVLSCPAELGYDWAFPTDAIRFSGCQWEQLLPREDAARLGGWPWPPWGQICGYSVETLIEIPNRNLWEFCGNPNCVGM